MATAISELIAVTGMCPFRAPAALRSNSTGSIRRRAARGTRSEAWLTETMTWFGLTEKGTGSKPARRSASRLTMESLPPPTADSGRRSESSYTRGGATSPAGTSGRSSSTCGSWLRYAYSARPLV